MRNIFVLALTLLYLNVAAQEKVSEQYVGWRGGGLQIHTLSGKEFTCSCMLALDSIKALVLDNNATIIQSFTVYRRGPTEKILGGFIKNSNIYLYMDNAENPGLHIWILNIADRSVKENILPFKIKKEKIITTLSSENHFLFFTINKRSSEFVIYDFKDESHYDTTHYIADAGTWDKISKSGFLVSPGFDVAIVDMKTASDIETAKCFNKIYIRNDNFFLVSNMSKAITDVYEFDLDTKKMNARKILHHPKGLSEQSAVDNSFLSENKLYYVLATPQILCLQVVDFYSGIVIKEFVAKADSEIAFKNTSILQEGSEIGINRELSRTKQLLRKITNGNIIISVFADMSNKQVEILIGSYNQSSGTMAGTGWTKSARFKMLLDQESNEHIAGELPPSVNDKIETYNKGIKIPAEAEDLFIKNNNYYYTFYDKEKRSFNVVKF